MKGTELDVIEQQAGDIIASQVAANQTADALHDLFYRLGGIDVLHTITTNLNAALIRNLQVIRDEELYRAAGYNRFDDFMNDHPRSMMSYKRFNYIEGIYKNLGPVTFDLMSGSGLSMRQMKLLGSGSVEVENGQVIIFSDDGSQESIEIANRRQWLDAITTLAKSKSEADARVRSQQRQIAAQDETIRNAHDDLDRERASRAAEVGQDAHSMALANACFALAGLREQAAELTDIDRAARCDNVLELLANQFELCRKAYLVGRPETPANEIAVEGESFGEIVENFLDQVNLDDTGDNDGELAEIM